MGLRRWRFKDDVLLNFRDLGGYPCEGGMVAYGRIFRSDQPWGLHPSDKQKLKDAGLVHVFDFRSVREKEAFPNDFKEDSDVVCHEPYLAIGSKELAAMGPKVTCQGENYIRKIEAAGSYYADLIGQMARCNGSILFHCTAGKDRTGIVAALILDLLGVDRGDIIADYQDSETNLKSRTPMYKSFYPTITDWELRSEALSMKLVLDWLKKNYGGAGGYLSARGMDEESVQLLKKKLILPQ